MRQLLSIGAIAALLLTGCEQKSNQTMQPAVETTSAVKGSKPGKGEQVPANLVCMVNDAYMGSEQLAVPFEGKIYYGCCEMCRKRIPEDNKVRYATDPQTLEQVDKATAYIVLIGDKGEVAYFKHKANYLTFKAEHR